MTIRIWPLFLLLILSSGCTSMITSRFAENLGTAILAQDDPETVRQGVPAYLIMLDSLVLNNPNDPQILQASASLHSAYASLFAKDPEQAKKLSKKARQQARGALCQRISTICTHDSGTLDELQTTLSKVGPNNIAFLYTYGTSWATWIQANKSDWNAMADVPKIEAVMRRVAALDETYEWGRAHLYLGVINSQLPPALGGQPEKGHAHFEKAIELSRGQDLIAKVELARNYARLVFDRELHDRLLNEVLTSETSIPQLTLSNTLAKEAARELLATSAEYFEE